MAHISGLRLAALAWAAAACVFGAIPPLPAGAVRGYHTLEQLSSILGAYHDAAPAVAAAVRQIGKSVEGRPLLLACYGACADGSPGLLLTCLQHDREPMGVQASLAFVHDLLTRWDAGEPNATALLARRAVWLIPAVNPDAYDFNLKHYATQKMARKNRGAGCAGGGYEEVGVDLNRNYDFEWALDNEGSRPMPCVEQMG